MIARDLDRLARPWSPTRAWSFRPTPIEVEEGTTIRAKATRYGYEESEEVKTTFTQE